MDQNNPFTIAELGCVAIGDIERAKMLINLAKLCNVSCVKFQKRNPIESTPKSLWDVPHPNQMFSYGKTYLEHRINVEFSKEQHKVLKDYCENLGLIYSTSVWDVTSSKEIIELNPEFIKVPSAQNNNKEILDILINEYGGYIHISTGMSSKEDKESLYEYLKHNNVLDRVVIYHCTSEYPCSFEHLFLKEIVNLKKYYKHVGFSNHGYGIASDVAALTLGATYFERHFVDDRMFKHTDAAASLEPEGLRKLVRDLNNVSLALKFKGENITDQELVQKEKLRG